MRRYEITIINWEQMHIGCDYVGKNKLSLKLFAK